MKNKIKQIIEKIRLAYFRYSVYIRDKKLIKKHALPKLTKKELQEINKIWSNFNLKESDLIYTRVYKKEYSFDPYLICDYALQLILKKTNPRNQVEALQHKGMIDIWFPELNLPTVYVRCISGTLYNKNMGTITLEEAYNMIQSVDCFIIKPTIETGCGNGVRKIKTSELTKENLLDIFKSYKKDFVVQEVIKQNKKIEELNPTSLNTCRVTSIYLNGKIRCSTTFKVGKMGADKDNWNSSYLIGVNNDGTLKECGYDNTLNKVYKTDLGIAFSGIKLPLFEKMISFVKEKHIKYYPHCGIIGWDIFIDNKNDVRVIEVNLDSPGVLGEQIASGTFFREFRDDIIEIMKNN